MIVRYIKVLNETKLGWKGPRAGQEWETGPLSWSGDKLRFLLPLFPLSKTLLLLPYLFLPPLSIRGDF